MNNVSEMTLIILVIVYFVSLGIIYIQARNYYKFEKISDFHRNSKRMTIRSHPISHYSDFPEPVNRFINYSISDDRERPLFVWIQKKGFFREKHTSPWKPLSSFEYCCIHIPGFVAQNITCLFNFFSAGSIEKYSNAVGSVSLQKICKIPGKTVKGDIITKSCLLKYLIESLWFPWFLLPSPYIQWENHSSHSAKVTISHHAASASAIFTFNEKNEVERIDSSDRCRIVNGKAELTSWTFFPRNYRSIQGVNVPTEGEAIWHLPEGDFSFLRFEIQDIQYNSCESYDEHRYPIPE